jgi:16S rRNA (cytosine1402-N4)-methyltransferase
MINQHHPILLPTIVDYLKPSPGKWLVDATLGDGGHTIAFLKKKCRVIAIDQDAEAIARAVDFIKQELPEIRITTSIPSNPRDYDCIIVHESFAQLSQIVSTLNVGLIDGILFDLGISTNQILSTTRGFSFNSDSPLDMRMDQRLGVTASDLVNALSAKELTGIFKNLADESYAGVISRKIVEKRKYHRIETTAQLCRIIESVKPRRGRSHPATQVFQALRMVVNLERDAITTSLPQAVEILTPGGYLAVLSFHSIEDRLVKTILQESETLGLIKIITEKPIVPNELEINQNPRSRSAKLRVVQKK